MKIKYDFVTNSSSCSYILIGFMIEDNELINKIEKEDCIVLFNEKIKDIDDMYEILNENGISYFSGADYGIDENKILIGKEYHSDSNTDLFDYNEINFYDIIEELKPILEGLKIEQEKVKIYTSGRSC